MRIAITLLLVGCNPVFGLDKTQLPPPDAMARCPDIGTVPPFKPLLVQAILGRCIEYTVAVNGRVTASCIEPGTQNVKIYIGDVGGELTPLAFPSLLPGTTVNHPRITPEGDELFALQLDLVGPLAWSFFSLTPDGAVWSRDTTLKADLEAVSGPSHAEGGRHVIRTSFEGLEEWAERDGVFEYVRTVALPTAVYPSISSDGLRVLAGAGGSVVYLDRSNPGDELSAPRTTDYQTTDGLMTITEGCKRLYFSGLDHVFYRELAGS